MRTRMKISLFQRSFASWAIQDNAVYVCSFARTPIGKLSGSLSSQTAPRLGAHAIKAAIERANIEINVIEEILMGNVVSAGIGQAPARQAAVFASLPPHVSCTTINKVCASGMKTAMFGSLSIMSGYRQVVIAGGMESMSNIPHYLPGSRSGYRLGHQKVIDGIINDGLWDLYNDQHMGNCGEHCAKIYGISRAEQDAFALRSYTLAAAAAKANIFAAEISPISISTGKGTATVVDSDEELNNVKLDKLTTLRPAFQKDGTVTAGNSSKINDGAAAMVLASGRAVREFSLQPLFRIRGFGDAERIPVEFTIAPADAVQKAVTNAGVTLADVAFHEINEAFAVVALANARILGLKEDTINVHGGAVALGHPIGCSGARILGSLYQVLKAKDATLGCASICNGGGGASAVVIERIN